MKCIIVSDRQNYTILAEFPGRFSHLDLIDTDGSPETARNLISKEKGIGLLILDADLPETDCFDFITSLNCRPNIIIVASDDQHALKAFDFNVIDYLIKPVTYPRFFRAVDKAVKYYAPAEVSNSPDNEVFIRKGSTLVKLKLEQIIFVEALENYVTLNTADEKFTILFTMKGIETQLPAELFVRIHRSFIVNKSKIRVIRDNTLDLLVGNATKTLPVGKSFREPLMEKINLISR